MKFLARFTINLIAAIFLIWLYGCGRDEGADVEVKQAEAGPQGEEGAAGEDGTTTIQVEEVPVEVPAEVNLWEDPVSGLVWLIGSDTTWTEAQTACGGDYRQTNQSELFTAALHGLLVVSVDMGGPDSGWASEAASGTNGYLVRLSGLAPVLDNQAKGLGHGVFCIQK